MRLRAYGGMELIVCLVRVTAPVRLLIRMRGNALPIAPMRKLSAARSFMGEVQQLAIAIGHTTMPSSAANIWTCSTKSLNSFTSNLAEEPSTTSSSLPTVTTRLGRNLAFIAS